MRSYTQLTETQRYQIEALRGLDMSQAEVARRVGVDRGAACRELKRNADARSGRYRAELACRKAKERRQKRARRRVSPAVWRRVKKLLKQGWSPQRISAWLDKEGLGKVSHELIYRWVWADRRRGGDLYLRLRQGHRRRRRYGRGKGRSRIPGRVPIQERPEVVETRSRLGDWEADTVIGRRGGGVLASLLERKSRLARFKRLPRRTARAVADAIIGMLAPLRDRVLTVTSDNGTEFMDHRRVARRLGARFYFADPYSSWQRGSDENANGLIRQYFPKSRRFDTISEEEARAVEDRLNDRPRLCLGWRTPNEAFFGADSEVVRAWREEMSRLL